MRVDKPWGCFDVLFRSSQTAQPPYLVKTLTINPRQRTSLQCHTKRSERWIVLQGHGSAEIDNAHFPLFPNSSFEVPENHYHRLQNDSDTDTLIVLEVQTGEYISEEDIIRLEDDYGRD